MEKPTVRMRRRLTRQERTQRTRADLLDTARRVFEERGFHAASLEEIAEAAGYSKGAIYANFAGKDELFLAVLGEHIERRLRATADVALRGEDLESAVRAVARGARELGEREPAWTPLLVEFWTHASRRAEARRLVRELHERQLDGFAAVIEEVARRHRATLALPARELARGTGALGRGLALERLLDPDVRVGDLFEGLFVAATLAVLRPTARAR
jgi:AcrR family transcriptional regulator